MRELGEAGVPFVFKWPSYVPPPRFTAPEPPRPDDPPVPQSGAEPKQKTVDSLLQFRGGAKHIDMRQARGVLPLIKNWIAEWGADWHRNRNGSYQAVLEFGEYASFGEGPSWALDRLQTAADTVPGPAMVRYGLWYPDETGELMQQRQGRSPIPIDQGGTVPLVLIRSKLVREYDHVSALADGWRGKGNGPVQDRGRLEVMWPSPKKGGGE